MIILSQNKKIALCAGFVFVISFATMVFFLDNQGGSFEHAAVDVIHAEENTQVENEEAKFRKIADNQEDPLIVINTEGKIEFGSEDFCKLLKVDCEKIKGALLFDYIYAKDLSKFASAHSKLVLGGEGKEGIGPYRMIRENEEILVIFDAYPVSESRKVKQIVFAVRDLTDQIESINDNDGVEPVESSPVKNKWMKNLYPRIEEEEDRGIKLAKKAPVFSE